MDNHNKELAARLAKEKLSGAKFAYSEISARTGYERRQHARIAEKIESGKDDSQLLSHGNAGRKPVTAASEEESRLSAMITSLLLLDSSKSLTARDPKNSSPFGKVGSYTITLTPFWCTA